MTDPDYRVVVSVGSHTYDVTFGDAPDYGIALPLSIGWNTPEASDFYPTQANPLSGSFSIVTPTIEDVADIVLDSTVTIDVYVPSTSPTPWQHVVGVVSQLDAQVGDRNVLTVFVGDPEILLSRKVVGLVDWPIEDVYTRVGRICTEAGILRADYGITAEGLIGLLPARPKGATDALSALRSALKDDASRQLSYDPTVPVYGRHTYSYDPTNNTLYLYAFERRVYSWPASLGADGTLHHRAGQPNSLDGCDAESSGKWSRLPTDRPTYVLVDGITFGDPTVPGAVPYVRNTGYVDGPGPSFPSATARVFLGRSLVPDDSSTNLTNWRTDSVRHLTYLDPAPCAGWLGQPTDHGFGWGIMRPTIIDAIDPSLTLDGRSWIGGLLTGARLTIPPGGRFYFDLTLRPDLIAAYAGLPTTGAARYADLPAALTYAGIDPKLTYRDLRLIGA